MGTATVATATGLTLLDRPEMDDELARVMTRVLTVLGEDDAPVQGLPTRQIRSRIRGQQKGRLLEALWLLQEAGQVTATAITYRGREGLRWELTDPLVPLSNVLA